MRHFTLVRTLCLMLALGAAGCDDDATQPAAFSGALASSSEVPPNTSAATGSATLDFDGNANVQYRIEVNGITGVTAAHVHSGASGANGPVRVTLFEGPASGPMSGQLAQGSFDSGDVQGISFEALLDELRNGTAYVNVHTTAYPDGEIRGQVRTRQ
ncbi:MAG TPA: CHRD domain-containing protein [Vicinamibacteria bacterium]|jgi:hypothetical protein